MNGIVSIDTDVLVFVVWLIFKTLWVYTNIIVVLYNVLYLTLSETAKKSSKMVCHFVLSYFKFPQGIKADFSFYSFVSRRL